MLERLERYDEALSDINHLLELDPGEYTIAFICEQYFQPAGWAYMSIS